MSHYDEGYDYGFGDDEDPAIPQDSSPLRRSPRNRAGHCMVCTSMGQLSTLPGGEDAIDFRPQLAQNSGYKTLTKERQRQVSDFACSFHALPCALESLELKLGGRRCI
ncbi:hypothetical protein C359_01401 [Cryptococcus neoformans Bt120]|nr:hypothetical protein C359_01401 [Cryptococcus neoformans var. grubii Bt120]